MLDKRVLIVEDEKDLLDLYYSILSNKRLITVEVEKAETAEKALELFNDSKFDLILTDYYLPEMDGITLIKEIKHKRPETEFILISGYLSPEIIKNAIAAGASYCIQKPSSIEKIITTVKKALSERHETDDPLIQASNIINNISEKAVFINIRKEIVQINSYIKKDYGDCIGKKCYEVFSPTLRSCKSCPIYSSPELKIDITRAIRTSNGDLAAANENIELLKDQNQKEIGYILKFVHIENDEVIINKRPVITETGDKRKLLVFHIDEHDCITYCDSPFAEKCEVEQEEIIGKPVTDFFHSYFSEYLKKIDSRFIDFARENEKMKIKLDFIKRKSKKRQPLICEFRNLSSIPNSKCSLMVLCTDEEENTQLSKLIQFERASSKQLMSGQFDMVITLDVKLNIKTINNICIEKLGIEKNIFVGNEITGLIKNEQDRLIFKRAIRQVNNLNDVFNLRLDIAAGTKTIPTLVNIRGVRDDFNNEIGYVVILRDIEKELHMEDTLSNIERMQALGQLAAGMAHQINNYISSLSGNTDLLDVELQIKKDNKESILKVLDKYMRKIRVSIARLSGLTKHLTSFARAQQRPVISLGSISKVINDVLSLLELRIMEKHISFNLYLDDTIPETYFSPLHLEQAVLNILMNAIDAVESSKGEIIIRTFKSGNLACISIKDNGSGIPEKIRHKIFEAFVTTKPSGVGTGLGLNVARDMITSLKGDLSVISEPGEGTEMIIKFPIIQKGDDI